MNQRSPARPPSLAEADLSAKLGRKAYKAALKELQRSLTALQQTYLFSGHKAVIVFEGWDAAGKGGTIRRMSAALDPRSFKVWPIGAPRPYYLDRHYLLRFMDRLPPTGAISVFDRSWYGRVLVERVEGLTPEERWRAAYGEIRSFERMLRDDGTRLVKLFFHITPDEQLARFERRLRDPLKRWKLTYEDFRNREKWEDYAEAIDEMLARTSTEDAPWHVIPANDKRFARVAALRHIVRGLSEGVEVAPVVPGRAVLDEADRMLNVDPDLIESLRGRTD
ncbi:polyphosphate kinase [Rhodosalinus halophilus]|uniref:Polyphosphate kinase n=1 Tax=Rhodosalinus halophilus TaxID=2259333 RepID=A0A365U6D9_9RHOB|nr:polyphosphate kinase [Rhodosalinus halophilus]RBI83994.1 polyphosphate kinase [Rhodosalinus halophilus]